VVAEDKQCLGGGGGKPKNGIFFILATIRNAIFLYGKHFIEGFAPPIFFSQ